jgi:hypothetical protein
VGKEKSLKAVVCGLAASAALVAATACAQSQYTVEGGQQARAWQDTNLSRDMSQPLHKVWRERGDELVVTTLQALPYPPARAIATVYKYGVDLPRKVAEKAVDFEQEDREARLVLIGEDGAKLRRLIDAGKSPATDAETAAVYRKLRGEVVTWRKELFGYEVPYGEELSFSFEALAGHGLYATTRVGTDWLIGKAIGKWTKRLGLKGNMARFGWGRTVQRTWQGEGRMVKQVSRTVWKELNKRQQVVRKFLDDYQGKLLDYALTKSAQLIARTTLDDALQKLSDEIRGRNPTDPTPRGPTFSRSDIRLLIQLQPAAMAAVAAAAPIAMTIAPPPIAAVAARAPDPVVQTIYREDAFVHHSATPTTYTSPSNAPPQRSEPAPQQQERRPFGSGPRLTWTVQQKQPNWDGRRQP